MASGLHPKCIPGVPGAEEQVCMVQAFCHLEMSSLGGSGGVAKACFRLCCTRLALYLSGYPHGSQLPSPPAQMLLKTSLWLPYSVISFSIGGRDHWSSCKSEGRGSRFAGNLYTEHLWEE